MQLDYSYFASLTANITVYYHDISRGHEPYIVTEINRWEHMASVGAEVGTVGTNTSTREKLLVDWTSNLYTLSLILEIKIVTAFESKQYGKISVSSIGEDQ